MKTIGKPTFQLKNQLKTLGKTNFSVEKPMKTLGKHCRKTKNNDKTNFFHESVGFLKIPEILPIRVKNVVLFVCLVFSSVKLPSQPIPSQSFYAFSGPKFLS